MMWCGLLTYVLFKVATWKLIVRYVMNESQPQTLRLQASVEVCVLSLGSIMFLYVYLIICLIERKSVKN